MSGPSTPQANAAGSFADELRVRVAEAQTQVRAAEALGEELQASIASSDLADLQALAARNDVHLDVAEADPDLPAGLPAGA